MRTPRAVVRRWLSRVVLPAPRKPVSTVVGSGVGNPNIHSQHTNTQTFTPFSEKEEELRALLFAKSFRVIHKWYTTQRRLTRTMRNHDGLQQQGDGA